MPPTLHLDVAPPASRLRVLALRGKPAAVDRSAHTITGASACTMGEALGHDLWLDQAFLGQVHAAGVASAAGIKSRFTHPGLSSDGLGKHLGRAKAFEAVGDQVRVNLELADAASRSPDGDLRSYVEDLATEDPGAFGLSIVFERDFAAEDAFEKLHAAPEDPEAAPVAAGRATKWGRFQSPDPKNVKHLRHARLKALLAVDAVDDPAANPSGLFSDPSNLLAANGEAWLAYLTGRSDQAPAQTLLGLHAERARGFVTRYLARTGAPGTTASQKEQPMPAESLSTTSPVSAAPVVQAPKAATVQELEAAFPDRPGFVLGQLKSGATIESARASFSELRIKELEAELAAARSQKPAPVAAPGPRTLSNGREVPGVDERTVAFSPESDGAGGDFLELARQHRDATHPEWANHPFNKGMREAIDFTRRAHPAVYQAWRASQGIPNARRPKKSAE